MMMQQHGLLSPKEITKQRVQVLGRVYQTADRVLTGDRIVVQTVDDASNPAPAWTDGVTITLNLAHIDSATSVEDLIRLTGLNFHELGHAMFTPRKGTKLTRTVISRGHFSAFNILEDQRLETFLTVMYPSTVPYFTATIMKYCATNKQQWEGNFLLTYGRKYLPKKVRDEFRKRFTRQDLIPEIEAIVDAYRQCVFPRDDEEGLALIDRFAAVLRDFGNVPDDPNGHSTNSRPTIQAGRAASQAEQEEAVDNIEDWDDYYDEDEDDDAADSNDGGGGGEESDDEGDGTGNGDDGDEGDDDDTDADGKGKGSGDDEGNDDDGAEFAPPSHADADEEDDTDDGSEPESTNGKGTGAGGPDEPAPLDDDALEDLLNEAAHDAEQLPEVQDDAKRKQSTIINGDGKVDLEYPDAATNIVTPDASHVATVRRLVKEFQQLQADSDPGYKQYRSSGRINIQRVLTNGVDFDSMFDEWDEGQQNATDIEAVVLVDISTSMNGRTVETSMALWTIKRALDEVDASVTVLAFSSKDMFTPLTYLLYDRDSRVDKSHVKVFRTVGGTQPSEAIRKAMRIFYASRRTHKLFIAVTDGGWFTGYPLDGVNNDEAIERMNANGITTATAYIGGLTEEELRDHGYDHNCQIIRTIQQPEHLVGWAREVVTAVSKNQHKVAR